MAWAPRRWLYPTPDNVNVCTMYYARGCQKTATWTLRTQETGYQPEAPIQIFSYCDDHVPYKV